MPISIIFANTSLTGRYDGFKNIPVVFQAGAFLIDKPLLLWINDGLMAVFFLLIGLEIKRELAKDICHRVTKLFFLLLQQLAD